MTFDPTKPVQTRDGRKARILATDLDGAAPIGAAVHYNNHGERLHHFGADGKCHDFGMEDPYRLDLINLRAEFEVMVEIYTSEPGWRFVRAGFIESGVTHFDDRVPDGAVIVQRKAIRIREGEGLE